VLLNLTDSSYYVLNETASLAFKAILEGRSGEQIAAAVSAQYDCSPEQAAADIAETIDYLTREGLLNQPVGTCAPCN